MIKIEQRYSKVNVVLIFYCYSLPKCITLNFLLLKLLKLPNSNISPLN